MPPRGAPDLPVSLGDEGAAITTVGDQDTAAALGSGDLPVLGSPRLAALMEQASCAAVSARLDPDHTSVGSRLDLRHLAPSRIGARIRAVATVVRVDGRRIGFEIVADDISGPDAVRIGTAEHERVIVDRAGFLAH